jgi:hypothetical protein
MRMEQLMGKHLVHLSLNEYCSGPRSVHQSLMVRLMAPFLVRVRSRDFYLGSGLGRLILKLCCQVGRWVRKFLLVVRWDLSLECSIEKAHC